MDLRLVCARAHDPLLIRRDGDAVARLFKLEVLQEGHTVRPFRVVFELPLSLGRKPVRELLRGWAGDCIDGHLARIRELHRGAKYSDVAAEYV